MSNKPSSGGPPGPALGAAAASFAADAGPAAMELLLQPLLDGTPAVVFVKDREGRHRLVNEAYLQLFGLTREQVIGRTDAELFPAEVATVLRANDLLTWDGNQRHTFEECVHTLCGPRTFRTEKFVLPDAAGVPRVLCGISVEITDLRAAQSALEQRTRELSRARRRLELAVERTEVAQQAAGASLYEYRPRSGEVLRNASLQAVTGHAAEEIAAGKDGWRSLLHPEDVEVFDRHLDAALQSGDAFSMEYRVRHKAGHWIWIADRGRLVRDADGQVRRIVGMVTDITCHRLAEEALHAGEQRFRATFDNAAVGIAHVGLDGRWLMVNDRLCAIVGRARQELLDHDFQEITHAEDLDADLALVRRMLAGEIGTYTLEKRYLRPDGGTVWVSLTVSLVRTAAGAPDYFISVVEDISVRRQAEHALREADARKDEFLATLAHELRNPLAPIVNATRVLARHEPLSAAGQRAVAMIERQAAQMKRLLDDLLEVSRITRGAIELRPEAMRLDAALRDAVEAAQPAFEAKQQRLHLLLPREPMALVADPVRLAQVLGNLLTNACKYTPEHGQVRVEAEQDAAGVTVRVSDDGIGIAAEQLEAVFGLFMQAEPGVGPYQGGLGIGLALVRRLVQMHGGHVRAESPGLGQGATFTVWLPRG